jgi:hypothetical protein
MEAGPLVQTPRTFATSLRCCGWLGPVWTLGLARTTISFRSIKITAFPGLFRLDIPWQEIERLERVDNGIKFWFAGWASPISVRTLRRSYPALLDTIRHVCPHRYDI